jgi:hypothetical protein
MAHGLKDDHQDSLVLPGGGGDCRGAQANADGLKKKIFFLSTFCMTIFVFCRNRLDFKKSTA